MSFDLDLLDDVLPQASNAPERARGKFLPKARRKNEKIAQQSISIEYNVQDEKMTTVLAPEQLPSVKEDVGLPGSPHCDQIHSGYLQRDGENSMGQTDATLPVSDLLHIMLPELGTTNGSLVQNFQPKETSASELLEDGPLPEASASSVGDLQTDQCSFEGEKMSASLDMGSVDVFIHNDVGTYSEAILPDHAIDLQVDWETWQEEEESEHYEDVLSQPTSSTARGLGKFQPKLGVKMKEVKAIASDSFDGMEGSRPSVDICPELVSHESPVLGVPLDSSGSIKHPTNAVMGENEKASAFEAASPNNHTKLYSSEDTVEKDMVIGDNRKLSRQDTSGRTVHSHSQVILDNISPSCRQLRKRTSTSIHTIASELDDEHAEDLEADLNDSQILRESSDDDFMGQTSSRKRRSRESTGSLDENPTPRAAKAPVASASLTQEPQKKRFPHSTRRSRRQVDKVLLETPEEDIDPMSLRIKDLIMLAEARERIAVKEAATKRQSTQDQSSCSLGNEEQGLNVDGDEADQPAQFSSTKLNYHTYMNRTRTDRWSKVDTELFYQGVRQFGSDFAMIQQLFPNRTRHQIKLKFKNEERKHPLQIADALIHRSNDHSQFQLVIERLQAQEENANAGTAVDARDESVTKAFEKEEELEEAHVQVDKKEEEEAEVGDLDHGQDQASADPEAYQEAFDWSQYNFQNSSPYDTEKDEYDIL